MKITHITLRTTFTARIVWNQARNTFRRLIHGRKMEGETQIFRHLYHLWL